MILTSETMHGALPTMRNLLNRKVVSETWCPRCGLQPETILHAIWVCDEINGCWDDSQINVNRTLPYRDFSMLTWEVLEKQGAEGLQEFMVVSWKLWQIRNRYIHEGTKTDPKQAILFAFSLIEEYKAIGTHIESPSIGPFQTRTGERWRKPGGTMYKLNFDGALCQSSRKAGFGVIIRNNEGLPMASLMGSKTNVIDPYAAEVFAAIQGLQLAHDIGIKKVIIIEGDSAGTIKALHGSEDDCSWLGNEILEARRLLQRLEEWDLSTICREANIVAHMLARQALHTKDTRIWMEDAPDFVCK
jgi:ribonuclease HI